MFVFGVEVVVIVFRVAVVKGGVRGWIMVLGILLIYGVFIILPLCERATTLVLFIIWELSRTLSWTLFNSSFAILGCITFIVYYYFA